MKFCSHCGAEIMDEAVVCPKCGCPVSSAPAKTPSAAPAKDNTMEIVVKIFMILGCVSMGWMVIPLAWCIPMTVSVFNKFKNHQPITTGFKVCCLLFVNIIAGICLLVMNDDQ